MNQNNRIQSLWGEQKTLADWARDPRCRVNYGVLYDRMNRLRWDFEPAMTTPVVEKPPPHPDALRARDSLNKGVKHGLVVKTACVWPDCEHSHKRVEGHHFAGYERENWRRVYWLCSTHHDVYERLPVEDRPALPEATIKPKKVRRAVPGEKYERLTVVEVVYEEVRGKNVALVNCECECGKKVKVLMSNLRSGNSRSCGCYSVDRSKENLANTVNKNVKLIEAWGEAKSYKEWSEDPRCVVSELALRQRITVNKWPPEKAISTRKNCG